MTPVLETFKMAGYFSDSPRRNFTGLEKRLQSWVDSNMT